MLLPSLLAVLALGASNEEWARVVPGGDLTFPADHGAHPSTRTEWWYLTGNLTSAEGRRFGFQFTVFRRGLAPGPALEGQSPLRARQVLAGHLALTDVDADRTLFAERLRRTGSPLARAAEEDLAVVLDDWSLHRREGDRLELSAGDASTGIRLDLELRPRKPLVLHGDGGYSAKGEEPGNASIYTSWTRLETSGRLRLRGDEVTVGGEAWFDHEYGSTVLEPGTLGWDWFGLQLEDGRELMLFRLRRADGSRGPASAATLVGTDGSLRTFGAEAFQVTDLGQWTSPHTAAVYPNRWRLTVPSEDLDLEVVPLVADCELTTAQSTGVAYWEGPVEVRGSVEGRGYAELTGYAGSMEGRF